VTLGAMPAALSRRTVVPLVLALLAVGPAAADVGTRAHPYKRGALGSVDGFAIRVLTIDSNAWRSPVLERARDRKPVPGRRDVLVTMRATNRAKVQGIPFVNGTLGAIEASGAAYSSLIESCGPITGNVSSIDSVPPSKTVIVHTCWQVPNRDAKSLVMYYAPYDGSHKTYFALR
jgi:hypothetical protein